MARTESIASDLRVDIVEGVFPAGDRLIESELCVRYSCGRAVARSALTQMQSEGLVERQPNRGATVRRITVDEAIEITEARAVLERLIAGRAARHNTASEGNELLSIVADMRSAVDSDNTAEYSELNRLLHRRLREISRHTIAAELVDNLRNRAVSHQYRLAMMPGRPVASLAEHTAIVNAVVSANESAAAMAMDTHLGSILTVLSRWGDVH
jgi:DNA-binding GntR family transcriptional regulator